MELHPDRNFGNVKETTELFAEVQSAYEVLSDPQERAWYDSHRSAILRGADEDLGERYEHSVRVTTSEDLIRTFTKFNARTEFSDSAGGFFGVLREQFDTLAKEELIASEREDLEPIHYPSFGNAKSNYEDIVRPFYAIWNGFATRKTFSWKDVYRYSEAPDRRVRRLMEKENKRLRDEAVRDFNETVRSLVQFVRKRDPRYHPNTQTEAERQKIIRDAATAQAARSRAANQARAAQQAPIPAWSCNVDSLEDDISSESQNNEPKEYFECVVCRKVFKSEKQFEAHEKSKKHIKAVQQLQSQMRSDDRALNVEGRDNGPDQLAQDAGYENQDVVSEDDGLVDGANANRPQDRTSTKFADDKVSVAVPEITRFAKRSSISWRSSSASSINEECAARETVENRILGDDIDADTTRISINTPLSDVDNDLSQKLASSSLVDDGSDAAPQRKLGKAKAKRAKKTAQRNVLLAASDFKCATCNAGFPCRLPFCELLLLDLPIPRDVAETQANVSCFCVPKPSEDVNADFGFFQRRLDFSTISRLSDTRNRFTLSGRTVKRRRRSF